jgi:hypothetical protein
MLYHGYLTFHWPRRNMSRKVAVVLRTIDRAPSDTSRYISAPSARGRVDAIDDAPALHLLALSFAYRRSPDQRVWMCLRAAFFESLLSYRRKNRPRLAQSYCMSRRPGRSAGSADVAQGPTMSSRSTRSGWSCERHEIAGDRLKLIIGIARIAALTRRGFTANHCR